MSNAGNAIPSTRSTLQGKVIQSQSREIVANVFAFMKREAEFGQQIPLRCVTKRVIAATGVSERSIRRIQREAEVVYSGQAPSFVSPRTKKKRLKQVNRACLLQDSGNNQSQSNKLGVKKDSKLSEEGDLKKTIDKMLYPSLEDLKVDQLARAQRPHDAAEAFMQQQRNVGISSNPIPYTTAGSVPLYPSMNAHSQNQSLMTNVAPPAYSLTPSAPSVAATPVHSHQNTSLRQYHSSVYPTLNDYMGLDLSPEMIAQNMPEYGSSPVVTSTQLQPASATISSSRGGMVAPISGQSLGLQRAQVTHGIREMIVCKDAEGKVGLRVQTVNSGVFVCVVVKGSPAAMAGLRFGDQILQVNGIIVAGYTMDQVHKLFKDSPINGISVVVRDRPFERTVTLQKNSTGHVGFHFKDGKIVGLVQDSSAARNGLLTDHHVLEVNGQNVVGIPDKDITSVINEGGPTITVTIIPSFVFDHMVKKMSSSLLKTAMDHSIPNV
ncbi:syntenin-1 [Frankliniella occidentalis]|uniref:Syntenin-1 n=1 Tax=Frankliniella occidentalis TaxID=133901 RepID=A0A9C6X3R2_FRAOC|nr:syntenin-1 [Frankliniella occidentalis]